MIASVLLKVTTAILFECAQISGHVWSTGMLVLYIHTTCLTAPFTVMFHSVLQLNSS